MLEAAQGRRRARVTTSRIASATRQLASEGCFAMIRLVGGSRLHYAWIIAGITFVTMMAAAGVRAMPGVLIVPLEKEFGWSRETTSLAVSINLLLYGLCGPFAAAIMERVGMRRMMA